MSNAPHILIIQTDQQRLDTLGVYSNPDIQTPHLDALAGDGVRYDNSFCPFPVCTPSRYSFLSGLYVRQHLGGDNHCTLPAGLPTFPKLLKGAGYHTKAVGKMHFTPTYLDVGYEEMELAEQDGPGRYDDDYHRWLREEGLADRIDIMDQRHEYRRHAPPEYWESFGAMPSDLDEAHHSTTWIAERAIESLAAWDDQPQLLQVSFIKPHHPFDPPHPWAEMYDPAALTLLPGWTPRPLEHDLDYQTGYFPHLSLTEKSLRQMMAYYYATISQIDHHVGRMVALLKEKGLYERTLIVYTSDHGDYLGYHHLALKGNHMYEPLMKVPLVIKYPGQNRAGTASETLVSNIDVAPTLLRAAGVDPAPTMTGLNLTDPGQTRPVVFAETVRGREYMARSRTHKLLLCAEPGQSQFFDLVQDPLELDNRIDAPAMGETVAALRAALLNWVLFENPAPIHLDRGAPVIAAANVPPRNEEHWQAQYDWFNDRMRTYLEETS